MLQKYHQIFAWDFGAIILYVTFHVLHITKSCFSCYKSRMLFPYARLRNSMLPYRLYRYFQVDCRTITEKETEKQTTGWHRVKLPWMTILREFNFGTWDFLCFARSYFCDLGIFCCFNLGIIIIFCDFPQYIKAN